MDAITAFISDSQIRSAKTKRPTKRRTIGGTVPSSDMALNGFSRCLRAARLGAALLIALAPRTATAEPSRSVRLCYEDRQNKPLSQLVLSDTRIILLEMVRPRLELRFDYVVLPWQRCLEDMQAGKVAGAIGASFLPTRLEMGVYPQVGVGKLDPSRYLVMNSYHLYVLKGSDLRWDGTRFANLNGPIATTIGYSVIDQLKAAGATIELTGSSADRTLALFQRLAEGRVQAVAMVTKVADALLRNHPDLAQRIEKYPVPLVEKRSYLMLSRQFVDTDPMLADRIWSTIASVRGSADYQAAVQELESE